jgi:hypothetical protein
LIALTDSIFNYRKLAKVVVAAPAVTRDASGQPAVPAVYRELAKLGFEQRRWLTAFGLTPSSRSTLRGSLVGPQRAPVGRGGISDLLS